MSSADAEVTTIKCIILTEPTSKVDSVFSFHISFISLISQNGPKPIQLVVPSAVMAAVSMLTMNCSTVFQVFFFMAFFFIYY